MQHRVGPARGLSEMPQQGINVGVGESLHEVVDKRRKRLVLHLRAGDEVEEIAQKRIGFRDVFLRRRAVKALRAAAHEARGEQAVGEGLRKHVGEIVIGEVGQERFAKSLAPVLQHRRSALFGEGIHDQIADEMGPPGHALGQLVGRINALRGLLEKTAQEGKNGLELLFIHAEFAGAQRAGQRRAAARLALDIPAELKVVGQQQVGQRAAVAAQLLGFFRVVERDADVLGLDVAEGAVVGLEADQKIGRAASRALGFVGDHEALAGIKPLQKTLEKRAVGVLGRIATGEGARDFAQVGAHGIVLGWHGGMLASPPRFAKAENSPSFLFRLGGGHFFDEVGGAVTGEEGQEFDAGAGGRERGAFAGVEFVERVVAGFDVEVGAQGADFLVEARGVENKNRVHKIERGEGGGADGGALHRARRAFEGADAGVAIERNEKRAAFVRRRAQVMQMPGMEQIEDPVGEHDGGSSRAQFRTPGNGGGEVAEFG